MPFNKQDKKFTDFLNEVTFHQFSYLKQCLDGLKDLGVITFDKEIFVEGSRQINSPQLRGRQPVRCGDDRPHLRNSER